EAFLLPAAHVLWLDAAERSRIAELLGIAFRTPQPRALGVRARLSGARAVLLRSVRRLAGRLGGGPARPSAGLPGGARAFAAALPPELPVVFPAGGGRVRRSRAGGWLLPRQNPEVVTAVEAVARDPRWVYPAVLALLDADRLP